jgi:hypothetical protein
MLSKYAPLCLKISIVYATHGSHLKEKEKRYKRDMDVGERECISIITP